MTIHTTTGDLFHQMTSLVMEQSETIMRIEDDVEEGLQNTVEVSYLNIQYILVILCCVIL